MWCSSGVCVMYVINPLRRLLRLTVFLGRDVRYFSVVSGENFLINISFLVCIGSVLNWHNT